VLAALAVWIIIDPLAGVDLTVRVDDKLQTVGPLAIAGVTAAAGLAAWGVLALMEPGDDLRRRWRTLAAGVLVLSLAGPISAGETTEAKLALNALHVIVGTTLIGLLGRTATG
jgi:hypothetical protein